MVNNTRDYPRFFGYLFENNNIDKKVFFAEKGSGSGRCKLDYVAQAYVIPHVPTKFREMH